VKTNGPKVMALIGNLTTFLVELGKGMAPLGSKILDLVNGFLSFSSALMKNHPLIGKIIAVVISLSGVILALAPGIILIQTMFGGFVGKLVLGFAKLIAKAVAWSVKTIAKITLTVAKWAWMGVQALLHAGKVAAAWTLATGKKMATSVAKMIATSATFVAKWALIGTKSTLNAGKMAAAWTLATGKKLAVAAAKMIAQSAMFVAKWVWVGAQSLIQAARVAAAWFIALGPVGWVIATVIALVALIIANWDLLKNGQSKFGRLYGVGLRIRGKKFGAKRRKLHLI